MKFWRQDYVLGDAFVNSGFSTLFSDFRWLHRQLNGPARPVSPKVRCPRQGFAYRSTLSGLLAGRS